MVDLTNFFKPSTAPAANANTAPASGGSILENAASNVKQTVADNNAAVVTDISNAPLDAFKGMWDIDTTKTAAAPTGVLPSVTADQLQKTLANSNFLSEVDPAILAKAASGDTQSFQDVINQGLRSVMTQSVLASHGLVEAGARNHGEQLRTSLPSMVRSSNVQDTLQANPLFNNPQAKPMIEMVRAQLELKHPQAPAAEIARLTQEFVSGFAQAANPNKPEPVAAGKTASGDTDWYAMLGL